MKKIRLPKMGVRLYLTLYFGSLFSTICSIMDFGIPFWISLIVFALMSIYGECNKKEITNRIDEFYGKDDEFK